MNTKPEPRPVPSPAAPSLAGFLAFVALSLVVAFGSGCASGRREPISPAATITGPAGASLAQTGDAATPAQADTAAGSSALVIPAGTAVSVAPDGTATFTAAEPVRIASEFTAFRATGPGAFTPPAPPSPADEARGWGVRAFYLAALVCALAAGLCLWRGYPLAALCAGGAALALPILANVVSSTAGIIAGAVFLSLGAGLVIAYHLTRRRPSALATA